MIFVAVGLMLGPVGFDLFVVEMNSEVVKSIATITLMLILFTDASLIDLKRLRQRILDSAAVAGDWFAVNDGAGIFYRSGIVPRGEFVDARGNGLYFVADGCGAGAGGGDQ